MPTCGARCQWFSEIRIHARGVIGQSVIHSPVFPCPDDHIKEAVARLWADILIKEWRAGHPVCVTCVPEAAVPEPIPGSQASRA